MSRLSPSDQSKHNIILLSSAICGVSSSFSCLFTTSSLGEEPSFGQWNIKSYFESYHLASVTLRGIIIKKKLDTVRQANVGYDRCQFRRPRNCSPNVKPQHIHHGWRCDWETRLVFCCCTQQIPSSYLCSHHTANLLVYFSSAVFGLMTFLPPVL